MNRAQVHAIVEPHVKAEVGHNAKWGPYRELTLDDVEKQTIAAQYMGEVHGEEDMSRFIVTEYKDGTHHFHWN